jgi:2-polyprenyl-3-methyl-5-hydroxy-6-metoxy-1,4-benzoquinol methylase
MSHGPGLSAAANATTAGPYSGKADDPLSSHSRIAEMLAAALAHHTRPRILDVGCGAGLLPKAAHERAPSLAARAQWVAVDNDPAALAAAAHVGMEPYRVDLNAPMPPPTAGTFDAVVFADVLEHVVEPEAVLRRWLSHACTPETVVLVSLPNVANLAVRLQLLAGRFQYTERGILDRTHLRFFTRRTARALLTGSGLRIVRTRTTPVPLSLLLNGRAPSAVFDALQHAVGGATMLWPTLLGFQFVFEARYDEHPQ